MVEGRRVNITPLAARFRSDGFAPYPGYFVGNTQVFQDASELHAQIKPELNAVTAVVTDSIFSRAYNDRASHPPFGLLALKDKSIEDALMYRDNYRSARASDINPNSPFSSLSDLYFTTVTRYAFAEFEDYVGRTMPENSIRNYDRLNFLLSELSSLPSDDELRSARQADMFSFLNSGLSFASSIMRATLRLVQEMTPAKERSAGKFEEVARNSYPLIMKIAAGHFDKATPIFQELLTHEIVEEGQNIKVFSPSFFWLRQTPSGNALDIKQGTRRMLEAYEINFDDLTSQESVTTGCPAAVNFGEESAIKKSYDWLIDVALKVYPQISG